jgi:hypothetical protein
MTTISNIRRQIYKSPKDYIFTTRDFLAFGVRTAVDQALYRLVKRGQLIRVARGVFIKDGAKNPSLEEVAKRKAIAFGRKIRTHCADIAKELKLTAQGNLEPTFATNGRTSAFSFEGKKIHFKSIGSRKWGLGKSRAGGVLRALWYLGKQLCQPELIMKAMLYLNRPDKQEIKTAAALMPAWLTDNLATHWA